VLGERRALAPPNGGGSGRRRSPPPPGACMERMLLRLHERAELPVLDHAGNCSTWLCMQT
jgi:hypothetical protein